MKIKYLLPVHLHTILQKNKQFEVGYFLTFFSRLPKFIRSCFFRAIPAYMVKILMSIVHIKSKTVGIRVHTP